MTPRDALHALGDLPRYEERLEMRTGGLTLMVWGLAIAGIFMTYAAAGPWLEGLGAYWGFSLLWVPWVVAGSVASSTLWRSHAITLRREPDGRKGWLTSLVLSGAFLIVAAVLFVALDVGGVFEWTIHSIMAMSSGVLALGMGLAMRRHWGAGARNLVLAGLAILAGAIAIGLSGVGETASGLLAATLTGAGWFTAGLATYTKG
jgi:hypothetical protein